MADAVPVVSVVDEAALLTTMATFLLTRLKSMGRLGGAIEKSAEALAQHGEEVELFKAFLRHNTVSTRLKVFSVVAIIVAFAVLFDPGLFTIPDAIPGVGMVDDVVATMPVAGLGWFAWLRGRCSKVAYNLILDRLHARYDNASTSSGSSVVVEKPVNLQTRGAELSWTPPLLPGRATWPMR